MNAPRELAKLLTEWQTQPTGTTVHELHGSDSVGVMDMPGWRAHVRGVELWRAVDDLLVAMEAAGRDVTHYRRWQHTWLMGIFVPDVAWAERSPHGRALIDNQGAIDQLASLADVIDSELQRYQVPTASREQSLGALDELVQLLGGDELSLQEHEKRYVFTLIDAVRTLLDEATLFGGLADLRTRTNELVGELNSIADHFEDAGEGPLSIRLRRIGRKVRPWALVGGAIALNAIGFAADMKELGGSGE